MGYEMIEMRAREEKIALGLYKTTAGFVDGIS
jgi:hypothetical protein